MLTQYAETTMALGSEIIFTIVCDEQDETKAKALLSNLWQQTFLFERSFSRFLPKSELSVFNRSAGQKLIISHEFHELLQTARALSQETDELFNPFILPALQRAGYNKSFAEGYEYDAHDDHSKKELVPVANLEIGIDWARIPYGTAIDIGGCGKGYLADQLADSIPSWVHGYWLSIGGDTVGQGYGVDNRPWSVAIYNDTDLSSSWEFHTSPGRFAAATSATTLRNGKNWHHIIDPRTQRPATSDTTLVSVYAESALQADVLASCSIILGSKAAVPFLKKQRVSAALIRLNAVSTQVPEITFGKAIKKKVAHYA